MNIENINGEVSENVLANALGIGVQKLRKMRSPGGFFKREAVMWWTAEAVLELKKEISARVSAPSAGGMAEKGAEVAAEVPELALDTGTPPVLGGSEKKSEGAEPLAVVGRGNGVVSRVVNDRWVEVLVDGKKMKCRLPKTAGLRPGVQLENLQLSTCGDFWIFTGMILRVFPGKPLRSL